MWSDRRDLIMKLLDNSRELYPRVCPCCGEKTGHVYFYKHGDKRFGSAWAWCSKCHEYSHSRYLTPSWWKNTELFTLKELHARPDNLDEVSESIDKWVNTLIENTNQTQ